MLYDFNFSAQSIWLLVLQGSILLSFIIYMVYYWGVFSRFAFYKQKPNKSIDESLLPPISIIISAKNEYLNLKENLPFLLNQDYPSFEVLVIDDHSQDETWDLLCAFRIHNPHLRVLKLTDSIFVCEGKKFPLSIGIKEARYSRLLLTDADCRPTGPNWILNMVLQYDEKTEIVAGYGKYYRHKTLLNLLIRFDTARIALQYFSAILNRFPYMGVGRNLSYKKSLFINGDGFSNHIDISSGDDDLFVSEHATAQNTKLCIDSETFMWSEPKKRLHSWWCQKRRHHTTGGRYKAKHKIFLGLYNFNVLFFILIIFIALALKINILPIISIVLIKWITQWIIFYGTLKNLKEQKLLLISPIVETIATSFNTLVFISTLIKKPNRWK